MDEALGLGQKLGQGNGALGWQIGVVEEQSLEVRVERKGGAQRVDALQSRARARIVAEVQRLEHGIVLERIGDGHERRDVEIVVAKVEHLERAVLLECLRKVVHTALQACQMQQHIGFAKPYPDVI